jgi:hypothetical protein
MATTIEELVSKYDNDGYHNSDLELEVSVALYEAVKSGELTQEQFVSHLTSLLCSAYGSGGQDA